MDLVTGLVSQLCKIRNKNNIFPPYCFSPDGSRLFASSAKETSTAKGISIFDTSSGECVFTLNGVEAPVVFLQMTSDLCSLYSCSTSSPMRIWSVPTLDYSLTTSPEVLSVEDTRP